MKRIINAIAFLSLLPVGNAMAQIITPIVKAKFGVEANLKSNLFDGISNPFDDDWFPDSSGASGIYVIDTTGAAAIRARYIADPSSRSRCFTKPMNYPIYTIVNGRFLYDALYIRDHYDKDSTAFASGNKNSQSPGLWTGGETPVPGKSDINDVMVHIRRDGPGLTDSLWFFAGLSLHNNTGNRYFDVELYQTDIYYNQPDHKFYNYGPAAGHTIWTFDSLGNVTAPGDVIFSAEFGSSSLTSLQARIWIDKNSLSTTPVRFDWTGEFDGDGSGAQYGYAVIKPKVGGNYYSGTQSADGTWAGPFGYIDVSDITKETYDVNKFMEIGVNMTKIGLDPYYLMGSTGCSLSFRRFFAKTRSSTSFTSELKDFAGPYRIARPDPTIAVGAGGMFCGTRRDSSFLSIANPVSSSIYTWTTTNGHIVTSPAIGQTILVDSIGTYIVTQTLFEGCMPYSVDSIVVQKDSAGCLILASDDVSFTARNVNPNIALNWTSTVQNISWFEIERSADGRHFTRIGTVTAETGNTAEHNFEFIDVLNNVNDKILYYRLKVFKFNSAIGYSRVASVKNSKSFDDDFMIVPNPAKNYIQIISRQNIHTNSIVRIYSSGGTLVFNSIIKGDNETIDLRKWSPGVYFVNVFSQDGLLQTQKKLYISN